MATKLDISQLDFDGIKDNLKTFLSQQDEFTDYDFEGSGMNILLEFGNNQSLYAEVIKKPFRDFLKLPKISKEILVKFCWKCMFRPVK